MHKTQRATVSCIAIRAGVSETLWAPERGQAFSTFNLYHN